MILKLIYVIVFIFAYLFILDTISNASGFTLNIDSAPDNLNLDEEGSVSISFSGDPKYYANKTYFLRLAFSQEGSSNYFGYTSSSNGEWVEGSDDKSKYFEFQTSPNATWSGVIKVKNNLLSPYFLNTDSYLLKVGRYTSSTDASADWSEPKWINLIGPTPSPSPSPTISPTLESKPTQTPAKTPTPVPIKTPIKTMIPSNSPSPTSLVLGLSENTTKSGTYINSLTPKPSSDKPSSSKTDLTVYAYLVIGLGILFIGYSGYLVYKKRGLELIE